MLGSNFLTQVPNKTKKTFHKDSMIGVVVGHLYGRGRDAVFLWMKIYVHEEEIRKN